MTLYLATENAGKIREMRAILNAALPRLEVLSVADLAADKRARYQADETGSTYAANALIKARALAALVEGYVLADTQSASMPLSAQTHPWVLAEDSGFEVAALGGAPGVYSARYAPDDKARCSKILKALEGMPPEKRRAQFVACMVLLDAGGNPTFFFGRKEGYIATEARGDQGFGYDPIFSVVAGGPTWGETGTEEKKADSHRSRALRLAVQYMIVRDSLLPVSATTLL